MTHTIRPRQQRPTIATILVASLLTISLGAFAQADLTEPLGGQGAALFDDALSTTLAQDPALVRAIVMTSGPPGPAAAAASSLGASVHEYTIIDGFAGEFTPSQLGVLAERPDVSSLHLDRQITVQMDDSHKAIEANLGWGAGYRGSGVTVAVIDTGIDRFHPWFTDTLLGDVVVACVSTVFLTATLDCQDTHGHGTHVAGSVASRDSTYPGIAPRANLAAVRAMPGAVGVVSHAIAAIDWVADNKDDVDPPIRVATMSLGYTNSGCGDDSDPWAQAANALVAKGVVFTVSAGNDGHDSCTIDGAAAASGTITVASVDMENTHVQDDDTIAPSSSGGPFGPHSKPDVAFPGVGITSAFPGGGFLISTASGTSMATPHAAGVAALLLEADPMMDEQDVKERITQTALENPQTGSTPNRVYGHGLGNACHALQLSTCRPLS